MGIQASTTSRSDTHGAMASSGKFVFRQSKRSTKVEKSKIGILAFEVSSAMSKCVQLWYSLSEQEIRRLTAEVIKSEGVLNLVSSNEKVLLSLASMEKLHELTTIAYAVARLGKRCSEPSLMGFEHIYNDILKHTIDVGELEYTKKEMDAKIKKMEKYIASTSTLYQELEILSEMEQALRRLQEEDDSAQKENMDTLQQKTIWQRQEVKYLKDVSLWSQTYDRVVGFLARAVCTMYGRIIQIFGFASMEGWSQILSLSNIENVDDKDIDYTTPFSRSQSTSDWPKLSNASSIKLDDVTFSEVGVTAPCELDVSTHKARSSTGTPFGNNSLNGHLSSNANHINNSSNAHNSSNGHQSSNAQNFSNAKDSSNVNNISSMLDTSNTHNNSNINNSSSRHLSSIRSPSSDNFMASFCFSPGRQSHHRQSTSGASYLSRSRESFDSSPMDVAFHGLNFQNRDNPSCLSQNGNNAGQNRQLFDPKCKLQDAPSSTLGGSALALHYANVVIIAEKMARYPQLITQDARDDLYQMLPKNVKMRLRGKLRSLMRGCSNSLGCECALVGEWKDVLEKVLGWLAPMAHNMIRWQSEHNFEQQQIVSRPNVLLLQTLYFADREKAEAAITELLVGLNCLWRHERDFKANLYMEYASNKDFDEYLEWQLG